MNILVTGNPGAGKTAVGKELKRRGYKVYDADEGFGQWVNKNSGQKITIRPTANRQNYYWVWDIDKVENALNKIGKATVFFCGVASNQSLVYKQFDKILNLSCNLQIIKRRLSSRKDSSFGKSTGAFDWIRQNHESLQLELRNAGAIEVDASKPLDIVVNDILGVVNA